MTEIFKTLSEESRLRILSVLMHNDLCVCELSECLMLKQSNLSRHLSAMKNSGLLVSYKQAQWVYYKVNENFIRDNEHLWLYLNEELKTMPNYEADNVRLKQCRLNSPCNYHNVETVKKQIS